MRRDAGLAEIPKQSRHHLQALAGDRSEQVLVRGVLRASRVGVWNPQRRQAENLREGVVRQRSTEVWENRRLLSRRLFDRARRPAHPGVIGAEPRRRIRFADADANVGITSCREMLAEDVADPPRVGADDEAELTA